MKRLFIALIGLHLSGCASIISGTSQEVSFDSEPGGGTIKLYRNALYGKVSVYEGDLPATIELKRSTIYKYDVNLDGYQSEAIKLKGNFNPLTAISIIFPPFLLVDIMSGASRKFEDKISIELTPEYNNSSAAPL